MNTKQISKNVNVMSDSELSALLNLVEAELSARTSAKNASFRADLTSKSVTMAGLKLVPIDGPEDALVKHIYVEMKSADTKRFVKFYTRLTKTGSRHPTADLYAATAAGNIFRYSEFHRAWRKI